MLPPLSHSARGVAKTRVVGGRRPTFRAFRFVAGAPQRRSAAARASAGRTHRARGVVRAFRFVSFRFVSFRCGSAAAPQRRSACVGGSNAPRTGEKTARRRIASHGKWHLPGVVASHGISRRRRLLPSSSRSSQVARCGCGSRPSRPSITRPDGVASHVQTSSRPVATRDGLRVPDRARAPFLVDASSRSQPSTSRATDAPTRLRGLWVFCLWI